MSDEKFCVFERLPDGRCRCLRGKCTNVLPAAMCEKRVRCKGGRPGVLRMAGNIATAAAREVVSVNRKPRTQEEIEQIQAVCRSNVCGLYNAAGDWCEHRACGCSVKRKPTWKMQRCPMGLWPLQACPAD